MVKQILLTVFALLLTGYEVVQAQNIVMSNATNSACTGNFYDSGGNAGNYGNNLNLTQTICSSTPGSCISISFTTFDLGTGDTLRIYNGNSTAAPLLGTYTGGAGPGPLISSTGCLTFVFKSNGTVNGPGWVGQLSCINCPTPSCTNTCSGGPAPANDACATAQNLGTLPAPSPCPSGAATALTVNSSNLCATAAVPYSALPGCQPSGANMANPAADVWYRFTISAPVLNIGLSGGLTTPTIGLYSGTSCTSLNPVGCSVGNAGSLTATFSGLAAGTYYLQVSGGNINDQCNYALSLQNNFDCSGCVIQSSMTVSPLPTNGYYYPGQTVNFCYTISNYNQTSNNWLHGVVPSFSPGWDMSTFVPVSSTNCSNAGTWNWYNTNVTGSATGTTTGPGFYYETGLGSPLGLTDGNPGNNYGDNNPNNTCDWTFCWQINTDPAANCVQGSVLNVSVNSLGDGESGSWISVACTQDPNANFLAYLNCCLPPTLSMVNPLCPGQTNGSATATGQGVGPWDYIWSDVNGVPFLTQNNLPGAGTASNLAAGTYAVTVVDATGCTASQFFTIAPAAGGTFTANANATPVACAGGSTGSVTVALNGGVANYSYAWTPAGPNGPTRNNLSAGTYSVVVTDANGCTATASATVTQPPVLNVNIPSTTNVACAGGQTGSITAAGSGGTPNYTYAWSGGASGPTASGLTAGTYTVTVTDNAGCTATTTSTITQPTPIVLSTSSTPANCGTANGSATVLASGGAQGYNYQWSPSGGSGATASGLASGSYNVTVTDANGCTANTSVSVASTTGPSATITAQSNVLCNGASNGSATVSPVGGSAPFSYSWSPSGGNQASASNLAAGNYSVVITDNNGCTATAAVVITQPTPITASLISNVPQSCVGVSDGSLAVQGLGGTPAYSVTWSNGAIGSTASSLAPGSYTATVTDNNGCTATVTASVAAASPIVPVINAVVPVSCNGGANGSATAQASGGFGNLSYTWSNGSATSSVSGLSAGTYVVTVTDGNGCTATAQTTISQPTPIVIQPNATASTCGNSNGSATAIVSGGAPGYSYSWSPTGGTTSTASGLAAGTYGVTVTDQNGCTSLIAGITVANQPGPQALITAVSDVTCNGASNGSVNAIANGGTGAIAYTWSNGATASSISGLGPGTYTVTATDANGCTSVVSATVATPPVLQTTLTPVAAHCGQADGSVSSLVSGGVAGYTYSWSNGSTNDSLINALPGSYSVVITDQNGCTQVTQVTVADTPPPVLAQGSITNALCAGSATGSAAVVAAGGTAPYSYVWSSGAIGTSASNLAVGTYTVTVTDAFGCTAQLTLPIAEPAPVLVSASPIPSTCGQSNGAVSLAISGGTTPYSPVWNTGASSSSLSGLSAGSYTVVVTDDNGCTQTAQVSIANQPSPVLATPTATAVNCNGGSNGTASVVLVSSSTGSVTYAWSPSGGTAATATGLSAGTYTVVATDANGCTTSQTVVVTEPPLLVPVATPTAALCNGTPTGSVSANTVGGVGPYVYSWSNGAAGSFASNLSAGTYTVTVTDNKGCTALATAQVTQPAVLVSPLTAINATCNGGSNGSVSVLATGGTTPYNYLWSTGTTASAISSLPAGTYTLTVTDANGCTALSTISVSEPTPVVVQATVTDATCTLSNGSAASTANGGTGTIGFTWSNGQTGSPITGLAPGNYTVVAADANGCTASTSVSIINYPAPTLNPPVSTQVSCNGGANGTASISVLSGSGPYAYAWSPSGGTSASASGLAAGNYSVVVTDNNGCTSTSIVAITQPAALNLQLSSSQATCGNPNGSAASVVTGGTSGYFYAWSNGSVNSTANGLLAGTYTLTVTDNNGCTISGQVNVPTPPTLTIGNSASPANCNGASTGSVSSQPSGGTSPFSFTWSNGSTLQNQTGLPAGSYTVIITDANGCTATTAAAVVTQPTAIVLQSQTTASLCSSANGTAQINGQGGTGILNYTWSTGQTGASIGGLSAGNYTVTATDQNGCTATAVASVSNLGGPILVAGPTTPVSCAGGSNGVAIVSVSSGNGPFVYSWTPSGGVNNTATGLAAGNYQVSVTDVNGCIAVQTFVVTQPSPLTLQTAGQPVACNGNSTGSASASVSGGVAGYAYSWSNGATSASISTLPAGNYTVLVTDANGCTTSANYIVTQPAALGALASFTNVSCNGGNNGTASVAVSGGTVPYAYTWSNGAGSSGQNNLVAGSYTVIVTDANGCTRSANGTITEPSAITLQLNPTPSTCGNSNGALSVVGSGGTGALQYQWSNGATQASLNNISAGTYTVTATDANGCSATINGSVNNQGGPQVALQSATNVTCYGGNNGSASVIVNSGVAPFTFAWSPSGGSLANANGLVAGSYTVNVTDGNGCISGVNVTITQPTAITLQFSSQLATCGNANGVAAVVAAGGTGGYSYAWSSGAVTATASGLLPGPYTVIVTDASGCTANGSVSVLSPSTLSIQTSATPTSCNGGNNGTASVVASGGNPGYSYAWSTGSTTVSSTGLTAGTYTVTVTDADGCSLQQPVVVNQPTALVLQTTAVDANCGASNGSVNVVASGATVPYQYIWSSAAASATSGNLAPGTYTVTVTDGNGCSASANQAVGVLPGPSIASLLTGNSACAGSAGGTAVVQPAGGVSPYTYAWSNGATTATITGLLAGSYTVVVSDAYGCTATQTGIVAQPQAMVVTIQSASNVSCNGGNDGSAEVTVSGGAPPFVYAWSNGLGGSIASGLSAGSYSVVVTDFNGCTETQTIGIQEPAAINLAIGSSSPAPCFGQAGAAASFTASGGTPPFTYSWSSGQTGPAISGVAAGIYTVTLTDGNGCTAIASVTLNEPPALQVQQAGLGNVTCFGGNNGTAAVAASGGTPGYAYAWSNGGSQSGISGLTAGNYAVTVTDSRGCTTQLSLTVTQPASLPVVSFNPPTAEGCEPLFVQFSSNNLAGATYQWNFGDGVYGSGAAPGHLYTNSGIYDVTLTVTDANGCTNSLRRNGIIRVFALPEAFFVTDPAEPNSLDPVVDFYNGSTGAVTAWWDFGDGTSSSTAWAPSHAYQDTGLYVITLAVRSIEGCVDTFQNKIVIRPDVSFWVPNAFTPNSDGDNETFTGYGINVKGAEFFIFDRWGTVVYQSDALSRGWNGTYFNQGNPCPEAVYVYLFRVDLGGTEPKEFTGRVSLVR